MPKALRQSLVDLTPSRTNFAESICVHGSGLDFSLEIWKMRTGEMQKMKRNGTQTNTVCCRHLDSIGSVGLLSKFES